MSLLHEQEEKEKEDDNNDNYNNSKNSTMKLIQSWILPRPTWEPSTSVVMS